MHEPSLSILEQLRLQNIEELQIKFRNQEVSKLLSTLWNVICIDKINSKEEDFVKTGSAYFKPAGMVSS